MAPSARLLGTKHAGNSKALPPPGGGATLQPHRGV